MIANEVLQKARRFSAIESYIAGEVTGRDLIQKFNADSDFLDGARRVGQIENFSNEVEFVNFDQQRSFNFLVPSGDEHYSRRNKKGTSTNTYKIKIKPVELFDELEGKTDEDFSDDELEELVRDKILNGDIKIHSESDDWLYWGFQFMGTQQGYALFPENRPPTENNPGLERAVDKHSFFLLQELEEGNLIDDIVDELKTSLQSGRFK